MCAIKVALFDCCIRLHSFRPITNSDGGEESFSQFEEFFERVFDTAMISFKLDFSTLSLFPSAVQTFSVLFCWLVVYKRLFYLVT
jgi:hypothetical protein